MCVCMRVCVCVCVGLESMANEAGEKEARGSKGGRSSREDADRLARQPGPGQSRVAAASAAKRPKRGHSLQLLQAAADFC